MSQPILLQTKLLVPRRPPTHVARPHLIEMMRGQLDHRLIVITAPAGYGKTTLAAEAVVALEYPTLWIQLDTHDNDPSTLLAYWVGGFCQIFPTAGERVRQFLSVSGSNPPERALAIILNELVEMPAQDWVFILDDYHFVRNPQIHGLMTTLVENQPAGMHSIIVTRNHPPLPLARWRAHGWLAEVREEHLRFSAAEVHDWAVGSHSPLSGAVIESLVERTEGWGAGIQLAMNLITDLSAEGYTLVERLSGAHPYIFNYLMEEVFERQPASLQTFLLHSAVLDQISAESGQAILGFDDAAQMLETLEKENLFLVRLNTQWFRYHHLFRDFLLTRLNRLAPDAIRTLRHRAGSYYRNIGQFETATQYFLLANDGEGAASCMEGFANSYLEAGRLDVLHRYLRDVPPHIIDQHPHLALIHGKIHRALGVLALAAAQFERVRAATHVEYRCEALIELAGIARSQGDYPRAQNLAREAVAVAKEGTPANRAFALMEQAKCEGFLVGMDEGRALAEEAIHEMRHAGAAISIHDRAQLLRSLGQICWWHGDVKTSIVHGEEGLACLPSDSSPLAAQILIFLATPYLYRHEYQTALDYAERAIAIAERLQLKELLPTTYAVLGNVLTRIGQMNRAESSLRHAIALATTLGAASYDQVMAGGYLAYNLVAQHKIDEARQVAETVLWPHEGQALVYEIFVCRSVLADIYLELEQIGEATSIFEELIARGEERQYRIPLAMAYFGLAYVRNREANQQDSLLLAQRSLALIAPSQAWELYFDQADRARIVCNLLAQVTPTHPFVGLVRAALGAKNDSMVPVIHETRPVIRVQALGSLRVFRGTEELDPRVWVSAKARDLLAYFITFRHEFIPLDRIVDALWVSDARHGTASFHTALYRLRHALRTADDMAKFIIASNGEYHLDAAHFDIDVDAFEQAIREGNRAPSDESVRYYQRAIEMYQGPFLNNLYFDWLIPEQQRLADTYLMTLRTVEKYHVKGGNMEAALNLARQALLVDPFAEPIHCDVMRYLYELGDRVGLHKQYAVLHTLMHDELGVEPLPETKQMYAKLIGISQSTY